MNNKRIILSILSITAILLFAFFIRRHTFDLPHYRGDQHHYVGLAFKLDTQGISGYNLRGIDTYYSRKYPELVRLAPSEGKGQMLESLALGGITYYDEPLHHMPFGFPAAIMLSHKIFASGQPYFLLWIPNDAKVIQEVPSGKGLSSFKFNPDIAGLQFYSIIVPLFSSLALILLVYMLSQILFKDDVIAIAASFLMAIAPVDILTSQKIWADDMTAMLAALAALLYILSVKKNKVFIAFLAGIFCGFSIITKQMGAMVALAIVLWHFLSNIDKLLKKETVLSVIFDKKLLLFLGGCILGSAYWFIKITSAYGDPLYRPHVPGIADAAETPWFKIVQSRPKHLYLLGIPYQNPLFTLSYILPLWLWLDRKNIKTLLFPLAWLVAAFALAYNFFTGEHRYMLTAYPAFCISSAYIANKFRTYLNVKMGYEIGTAVLVIALILSAFWSVPMALEVLFSNGALIMRPF